MHRDTLHGIAKTRVCKSAVTAGFSADWPPAPLLGSISPLAKRGGDLFNAPVLNQQTLNRSATFSGVGLHSGNRVTMNFLPAPPNPRPPPPRVPPKNKPKSGAAVKIFLKHRPPPTAPRAHTKVPP